MSIQELRLECLKIAVSQGRPDPVRQAEEYVAFLNRSAGYVPGNDPKALVV